MRARAEGYIYCIHNLTFTVGDGVRSEATGASRRDTLGRTSAFIDYRFRHHGML